MRRSTHKLGCKRAMILSGALAAALAPISTVFALDWDPGHSITPPGSGGTGIWDNSTPNWSNGSADTAFNGTGVIFDTTGGTVTLGAAVNAASLTLNVNGYTITNGGTAADTLTLGSAGITQSASVSGTNTIGAQVISGGLVSLNGGTLVFSNTSNSSGFTSAFNVASGASLEGVGGGSLGTGAVTLNNNAVLNLVGVGSASTVSNFGGTSFTGYTVNTNGEYSPVFTPFVTTSSGIDTLKLTEGVAGIANSVIYNTRQAVGSNFNASFTYKENGAGTGNADGATFFIQDNGISQLGVSNESLGYAGISNSVAVELHIYSADHGGVGTSLLTDGNLVTNISTSPVNLTSGDPISVQLQYSAAAQSMTDTLTDQTTSATFTKTYTGINIATTIGSSVGFIGFSGGTGGDQSDQYFSNFIFTGTSTTDTYANNVSIPDGAAATINTAGTFYINDIGTLTLGTSGGAGGATLTVGNSVAGYVAGGDLRFSKTVLNGAAAPTFNVGTGMELDPGAITPGSTGPATVNKIGAGLLLLDNTASADLGGVTNLNISAGSLTAVGVNGGNNPLGTATVTLAASTSFALSTMTGTATFNNPVTLNGSATISTAPPGPGRFGPRGGNNPWQQHRRHQRHSRQQRYAHLLGRFQISAHRGRTCRAGR